MSQNIVSKTGDLLKGIKAANSDIMEGVFKYNQLLEGVFRQSNGIVQEGVFDIFSGFLLQGKRSLPDGQVQIGEFSRLSGELKHGQSSFGVEILEGDWCPFGTGQLICGTQKKQGSYKQGQFCSETGFLVQGEIFRSANDKCKGLFNYKSGKMLKGDLSTKEGEQISGIFNLQGQLILGKHIFSNGNVAEGVFDSVTGNLLDGQFSLIDGSVCDGVFDNETNELVYGSKKIGNQEIFGHYDRETGEQLVLVNGQAGDSKGWFSGGRLLYGVKVTDSGIKQGLFDQQTGNIIKGRVERANWPVTIGLFDLKGNLIQGQQFIRSQDILQVNGVFFEGDLIHGFVQYQSGTLISGWFQGGEILFCGAKVYYDGKVTFGSFYSSINNGAYQAKVTFPNGDIEEGKWTAQGHLIQGSKKHPDGRFIQGMFDELGQVLKGSVQFSNGDNFSGVFEQGKLIKGAKLFINGTKMTGTFDLSTGELAKGEARFSDLRLEHGIRIDGKLRKGCKYEGNQLQCGEFNVNGELTSGFSGVENETALKVRHKCWFD